MVLGILRRRKKADTPPRSIPASPSLPNIPATNLSWPSDFIADTPIPTPLYPDVDATDDVSHQPPFEFGGGLGGGRELFRQSNQGSQISFHRPFRKDSMQSLSGLRETSEDNALSKAGDPKRTIASIYASQPIKPFASSAPRTPPVPPLIRPSSSGQRNKRRVPHVVPTFNLMIVGGVGTGKSSLARLLLDTCQISPSCPPVQKEALENFTRLSSLNKTTRSIESATVEIDEGPERIAFTVLDTPGLLLNNELDMERSVTSIIRYLDARFEETLEEENKVDRRSKGDKHVHLCIYLVAPEAVRLEEVRIPIPSIPTIPSELDHGGIPYFTSEAPATAADVMATPAPVASVLTVEGSELSYVKVDASDIPNGDLETTPKPSMSGVHRRTLTKPAPEGLKTDVGALPLNNSKFHENLASPINPPGIATNNLLSVPPLSHRPMLLSSPSSTEYRTETQLRLASSDITAIKRLSEHVNVLPIISRADTLTEERLEEVKRIVRRDLVGVGRKESGDVRGVVEDADDDVGAGMDDDRKATRDVVRGILTQLVGEGEDESDWGWDLDENEEGDETGEKDPQSVDLDGDDEAGDEDYGGVDIKLNGGTKHARHLSTETTSTLGLSQTQNTTSPTSKPRVVQIKPTHTSSPSHSSTTTIKKRTPSMSSVTRARPRSHSRSRLRARAASTNEDIDFENAVPREALGRASGGSVGRVWPFAVCCPDPGPSISSTSTSSALLISRQGQEVRGKGNGGEGKNAQSAPPSSFGGGGILQSIGARRKSVHSAHGGLSAIEFLTGLRGKFVRNYRWGSVDVLNPEHCDYLTLRAVVLGPRMRCLKQSTNEVLYENYRTQKLLELKQLAATAGAPTIMATRGRTSRAVEK